MRTTDNKKRALQELALTVRLKGTVKVYDWCRQNHQNLGYSSGQTLYQTVHYCFKTHPDFRMFIIARGTLSYDKDRPAGSPEISKPRFSYGIPKDPPRHKVSAVFNPNNEEDDERPAVIPLKPEPKVRFSDAYVQAVEAVEASLRTGKPASLDLGPLADMLEELLILRKAAGKTVGMGTTTPTQKHSLGGISF